MSRCALYPDHAPFVLRTQHKKVPLDLFSFDCYIGHMSKLSKGTVALREYLGRPGAKSVIELAVAVGVSMPAIYRYKNGGKPASKPVREALERATDGAVPASIWLLN